MTHVELSLKEISGLLDKTIFGIPLIKKLLGSEGKGVKLIVPFGDALQEDAKKLFVGAFSYYRNYTAHDGSKIDRPSCQRILIVASELLYLIDASTKCLDDPKEITDVIRAGIFSSKKEISTLVVLMDGYAFPDMAIDGFFEDLYNNGFSDEQYEAVFDLGLIAFLEHPYTPDKSEMEHGGYPETIGHFELTDSGRRFIADNKEAI